MNQYHEPAGRGLEIIIGMVMMAVTLLFLALLFALIINASIHLSSMLGGLALALAAYWFGQISVRLLFNLPRKNGGLFSCWGLKLLCVFLGLISITSTIISFYTDQLALSFVSLALVAMCFLGWKLAHRRQ